VRERILSLKLREKPMKKLTILTLTALLAGAVFGAGGAWAQATFTPVSGEWAYAYADPGTQWTDDEGILHVRDAILVWTMLGGDLEIVGYSYSIVNINIDPAGNGDGHSFGHFEVSFDGLVGVFEGHDSGPYTGGVYTGEHVHHGSGDFAGMRSRGTTLLVHGSGYMSYEDVIQDPHGGKSAGEPSSWSSVKALYR
jgi:hypothetical protein